MAGEFMRNIPTPEGNLVTFPRKTVGITREGQPIVDPEAENCYSIVHVPNVNGHSGELYKLEKMTIDMAFTVDQDNLVTVDGLNLASAAEYALFDSIVGEFESRVAMVTDDDMRAAREAARYR